MSDRDKNTEAGGLDALFDAARDAAPVPSAGLLARIARDAADQHRPQQPAVPAWQTALGAIGGWFGAGGLATAALAGVYIGFANPFSDGGMAFFDTVTELATTDAALSDLGAALPGDLMFFEEG